MAADNSPAYNSPTYNNAAYNNAVYKAADAAFDLLSAQSRQNQPDYALSEDGSHNIDENIEEDNEENIRARPFFRRAVTWNDDQFITLDSALKWNGRGGTDGFLVLAIPETDAFFWVGRCQNGITTHYIQSVNGSEEIGARVPIYIGTDKMAAMRYAANVAKLPFGDSDGNDPTLTLSLPVEDDLFVQMAKDNWLYVISGSGDNLMRTRISLAGSAKAINAFKSGCVAEESSPAFTPPIEQNDE